MVTLLSLGLAAGGGWCAALLWHDHRHPRCRCLHPFRRHHARPVSVRRHARLWIVEGER